MGCSPIIWVGDDAQLLPTGTLLDSDGNPLIPSSADSFKIIQTDLGTYPTADSSTDTLILTSTSLTITGNSTLDTITIEVDTTNANTWSGQQTFGLAPILTGFTEGSVLFIGANGELKQNNANFFYNNATGFLRIEAANGVVIGDTTGNTRGANSVDLQSSHSTITQVASGTYAVCIGSDNLADGDLSAGVGNSVAIGYANIAQPATDGSCIAVGGVNEVYRANAVAMGNLNVVGENFSGAPTVCIGISNTSAGTGSSSIGVFNNSEITDASPGASAIGNTNTASVGGSSAIGRLNTASATASSAIGNTCTASNSNTAALGFTCVASGFGSIAVGNSCNAYGSNAIVIGRSSSATASTGLIMGSGLTNLFPTSLMFGPAFTGRASMNATGLGILVDNPQARLHVGGSALIGDQASLGAELTTNGTFTGNANSWTLGTGWAYNSNNVIKNADGTGTLVPNPALTIVAGKLYQVTYAISAWTVGTVTMSMGGVTAPVATLNSSITSQTITNFILATATTNLAFTPTNTSRFTIDTVTVREVIGGQLNVVNSIHIGSGNMGTASQARLYLPAGTTTALTAPLKFTTGTSMTVAESGSVEFTTDDLFFTITTGTARKRILFADPVGGLTSGRIPFGTTNGRLTDAATLTYATNILATDGFQCDSITNDTGLAHGTYTPTRSAEVNMDGSVTMSEAQYMRVGNTVTVSGRFTADPTLTATATSFEFSLPVASNIGAVEDLSGVAFCGAIAGMGAALSGSVANNTAVVSWISSDVTSQTFSYTMSYQVI